MKTVLLNTVVVIIIFTWSMSFGYCQSFEIVQDFEIQNELRSVNGVSVADYDLDGDLDLFLVAATIFDESDPLTWSRLMRNDGEQGYSDVTLAAELINYKALHNKGMVMGSKMGASWGDYNNDGYPDIFLTNFGLDELWRNEGNGKFTNVTQSSGVQGCQFCYSTTGLWWDYDLDGDLDLFVCDWIRENRLYRNDGEDTFVDITIQSGLGDDRNSFSALPIDINYDGLVDLYVANDAQENGLFLNNGDGTFSDWARPYGLDNDGNGMGMDVCDYNNDGRFDIYVTNIFSFEPNAFFVNNGDGLFSNESISLGIDDTGWGWGVRFFDADHDLDEDLYAVNGYTSDMAKDDRNTFFLNDEDGFKNLSSELGVDNINYGMGLEVFDYDGDGDFDMIVGNRDAPSSLYKNTNIESSNIANNWLQITLEGTVSNRNAFGAKIRITCDGEDYYRYYTGMNLFGQSIKSNHFGLSDHTMVDQVEVTWPDGSIEIFTNVRANQVLHIKENTDKKIINGTTEKAISSVVIFPNPFSDELNIDLGKIDYNFCEFKILNTAGQELFQKSFKNDGSKVLQIDFQDNIALNTGVNLYILIIDGEIRMGKIIR